MKVGGVDVGNGVYLAPMAGYTDKSFRRLCKRMGCDVVVTEMVSAKALSYNNENTWKYLDCDPEEAPVFVQIFGSEPEIMAAQAERIQDRFAGIDINMGCPAPKVFRNHEGSALLAEPEKIYRIVRAITERVHVPVTVKIRKGIREDNLAVEAALAAQEGGCAAVAVHGRTAAQMYHGQADWEVIRQVKQALRVPVIGNGDIRGGQDALRMKKETGCDGVMVGRAARGNPWIFREIQAALNGEPEPERPDAAEVCRMILLQSQMICEQKGEYTGMREMRAHIGFYARGFRGSSRLRSAMQQLTSLDELREILARFQAEEQLKD